MTKQPNAELIDVLRRSIESVADSYELKPDSAPSSTIAIVRAADEHIDYLILGDSSIVILDSGSNTEVIKDDRLQ